MWHHARSVQVLGDEQAFVQAKVRLLRKLSVVATAVEKVNVKKPLEEILRGDVKGKLLTGMISASHSLGEMIESDYGCGDLSDSKKKSVKEWWAKCCAGQAKSLQDYIAGVQKESGDVCEGLLQKYHSAVEEIPAVHWRKGVPKDAPWPVVLKAAAPALEKTVASRITSLYKKLSEDKEPKRAFRSFRETGFRKRLHA